VWVEDGGRSLVRADPGTGEARLAVTVGQGLDGVAVGEGSVWVVLNTPPTLLRIDPRTGVVQARIPLAARAGPTAPFPIGVAVGNGAVWVLSGNTGTVSRIDPALNAVVATSPRISLNPVAIAAGAGAVWVADGADDAVDRIDPATARVTREIPL